MSRTGTLRALTYSIKMLEQHAEVRVGCDDYFIRMLKEARDIIGEAPVKAEMQNKSWAICEGCGKDFRAFMMPDRKAKCCPNCGRRLEWSA